MGSIEIFSNLSNFTITLLSLLVLGGTVIVINQGKLPEKRGLTYLFSGLLLELIAVGVTYMVSEMYSLGRPINALISIELLLLLITMLFLSMAALQILSNNLPELPITAALGGIGLVAIIYFVYIYPSSLMVANMQQIFIITGFLCISLSFWSQMHRRHAVGFLTAALACSVVTVILLLRFFNIGWDTSLINNWYLSPLFYNVMAVAFIAINADFLARRLDASNSEIVKYNRRIEEIIKSSPFPIIISRLSDDRIILANNNAVKLFGIDPGELERYRLKDFFVDAENRTLLNERLEAEKEVQDFEILVKSNVGDTPFWLLTSVTTIDYNYDVVLYAAFQDITSRKKREVLLKNQAIRDPLTSLFNRRYFEDEVNKRIALARSNNSIYCILMADVDLFKRVNDTYGHKTGDNVLIELAGACERALRDQDIVARYGGEEFVIFLADVDYNDAKIVAERLRKTIADLTILSDDGREVKFTISIGISSSQVSDNIDTLIKTADEALYKAKQNGRNRVEIFDPADLKNFNPDDPSMHKDESATRHPAFNKEENVEISLLDGIEGNHIQEGNSKIEEPKKSGGSSPEGGNA